MVLNSGTAAPDYIDILNRLTEIITSRNLTAVAVNAGGTGHAIGDVIEIDATGSTSTHVAQLEVTSVSGGIIDGIRVFRGGAYTVDPTTTVGNAQSGSSGAGINATFDITMSAATWAQNRRTQEAVSAVISAAGTGYTVGDQLTLTLGGTGVQGDGGVDAVFNVDSISGGGGTGPVLTVSVVTAGNYEEIITNPAPLTGGTGGDDCTLTVTYAAPDDTQDQVAMFQGEGSAGTDEIHIGIKTYQAVNGFDTAFNWALLGMQSYNAALPIQDQTGVNPLAIDISDGSLPVGDTISAFTLKNDDAFDMDWWIHHDGRSIRIFVKVESGSTTQYASCYMGFLNQTATDTEYPYPLWICGNTNDINRLWTESSLLTGGIVEVISATAGDPRGPGWLLLPDGTWVSFAGAQSGNASTRIVEAEWGIYPFFDPVILTTDEQTVSDLSDVDFTGGVHDLIPATGVPGTETMLLKPTPGTGDDYYWLVAPIVIRQESGLFPTSFNMYGEIAGVFWFSRGGNVIVSEDRFVLGTKRYLIFQNGNRTQNWSYLALDED